MKVIGLSGKIGVGISTVAGYLVEADQLNRTCVSFAGILKQEVHEVFGVPLHWCYECKSWHWPVKEKYEVEGRTFEPPEKDMSVRNILQWWGTEVRRTVNPGYWVNSMKDLLVCLERSGIKLVIIDDVRFSDEAQLVKDCEGALVRIEPYTMWRCDRKVAEHISETALDFYSDWDLVLNPEFGYLEEAAEQIQEFIFQQAVNQVKENK